MSDKSKYIEKIEKLLRRAKAQEGEPEGETAATIAARLMAQHAISMDDISIEERKKDPMIKHEFKLPSATWQRDLMWEIARHCNCQATYQAGGTHAHFYGYKTDCEIAEYLMAICSRQIKADCKNYLDSLNSENSRLGEWDWRLDRCITKKWYGSQFRFSAVRGLRMKLQDIRDEVEEEVGEQSYALVKSRYKEVETWVEETFTFRTGRTPRRNNRPNEAGFRAGKNISLNAGLTGKEQQYLNRNQKRIGSE